MESSCSRCVVPTSQEENPIVSNSVRRSALSDLGSYLFGLVSIWPRRNYYYEELQEGINRAVIDHSTLVGQDAISVMNRRQALISLGLVPVHLIGTDKAKKADPDLVLKHCAAAITACWYLRRGKDLAFASDLTSSYISILEPLVYSHSEAYRKAAARLLSQSFTLKSKLTSSLQGDDLAIAYEEEDIVKTFRRLVKEYYQVAKSVYGRFGLVAFGTDKAPIAPNQLHIPMLALPSWEKEEIHQLIGIIL